MKSRVIGARCFAPAPSRSGTVSIAMTRSAPSRKALLIANWPTGPQPQIGDRVAALDVAEIGRHVAGRKDVGEEQHLLVGQAVRHLDRADIGIGHAQIFRLTAGIAAQQMRVAEQSGGRMAPQLLGLVFDLGLVRSQPE